ncbi:hypothetical protein BAUCODRAFT_556983 [Baudoinia panamericana UAMH 10762]|uniref:Uncharacterized protein n=1 Tax=Baudoinia panamericana (strain UAMH 10762) TaxID=717646 RepID=M2MT66_BAUPA|nr:uncharacterized protein BAUCODRAFT_556983 [Baudoinia panamericana UAMH 10762]EMC94718.1 hypothetical protein BAUCODRAFT_556983 [Baudoinia panamericana UAMH 10762]
MIVRSNRHPAPWHTATYATSRPPPPPASSPPQPRPYRPSSERQAQQLPTEITAPAPQRKKKPSLLNSLFEGVIPEGPKDPARGLQASQQYATTGKVDPRYKPAARRWVLIIAWTPFVIYGGYELFQRRFFGKEAKVITAS